MQMIVPSSFLLFSALFCFLILFYNRISAKNNPGKKYEMRSDATCLTNCSHAISHWNFTPLRNFCDCGGRGVGKVISRNDVNSLWRKEQKNICCFCVQCNSCMARIAFWLEQFFSPSGTDSHTTLVYTRTCPEICEIFHSCFLFAKCWLDGQISSGSAGTRSTRWLAHFSFLFGFPA